jgi:hypothetical protein
MQAIKQKKFNTSYCIEYKAFRVCDIAAAASSSKNIVDVM